MIRIIAITLFVVVLFGGGFVVARRAKIPNSSAAVALGLGILWSAAIIGFAVLAVYGPNEVIQPGEVDHRGYGSGLAIVGSVMLALIAFVVSCITAIRVARSPRDPNIGARLA